MKILFALRSSLLSVSHVILRMKSMKKDKFNFAVGGQALIEGVMMRSPHALSIACRRPDGSIVTKLDHHQSLAEKLRVHKIPIVRGMLSFVEMMVVGIRALNYSAAIASEEEDPVKNSWIDIFTTLFSILLSLAFFIVLFKWLPLKIATQVSFASPEVNDNWWLFNLVDGIIKLGVFLGYLILVSLFPQMKRLFAYHGAEHKSVFTYEDDAALTPEQAKLRSRFHPRCGTSFLFVVIIASILLYTVIPPASSFTGKLLVRIALLPIIAGFSFEILKISGRFQNHWLVRLLSTPGLLLQRLTTKEPDTAQLEIALIALKNALTYEEDLRK